MSEFKVEPHNFSLRAGSYQYCCKCGLVAMNNEFSRWAMKTGCDNKDHPGYEHKRGLTNPF